MPWVINQNSPQFTSMSPEQQQQVLNQGVPVSVQSQGAGLQQTQASTQQTQAQIPNTQAALPGIQAQSSADVIKAQQVAAQQGLGKDLGNKMTLGSALKKYTALGMSPDDVFSKYLASSPWGLPNESPTQLEAKGISAGVLGKIGDNGSFADKWNTKQAVLGLRDLQGKWNGVNILSKLGVDGKSIATPSSQGYESQRQFLGEHLSSLIPGASGAQSSVQDLMNSIPDIGHISQTEPGAAQQMFEGAEQGLLNVKGYKYSDLGITTPQKTPQTTGKDLLNGILQTAIPAVGAVGGAALGGLGGAAIPGADLTGVPEVAGAMAGSGAGGAAGQALADYLTGKKPGGDVAVTGALSAGGEGVGSALGGILGKVGGVVGDYGEGLVSKGLNLTPKMSADAAKDMGVKSVGDFLTNEGLQGANFEKISGAVQPIQDQFDAIAKNPNIKIDPSKVVNGFDKQIQTLKSSILPADQAKANVLDMIATNFIDKFGGSDQVGADAITALRKQVDAGVKDFGADPVVASTGNMTRGILQKAVQDADPSGSLDGLGSKLHQYYSLLSKAEPRQFASAAKPLLGAKDAVAGFLGNIFGGPVGAGAGIGLEKILGSQGGTQVVSKGAMTLGDILKSQILKGGLKAGGAFGGGALGAILGH